LNNVIDQNKFVPTLPSAKSAYAFLTGQKNSEILLLRDLVGRAAIIYLGMKGFSLVSGKEPEHMPWLALAGAAAIEAFVLVEVNAQIKAQHGVQNVVK